MSRGRQDRSPDVEPAKVVRVTGPGPLAQGLDLPLGRRCTTLVGPNAAGKSLVLQALAPTSLAPTSVGHVTADTTAADCVRWLENLPDETGGRPTADADRRARLEELLLLEACSVVPEVDRVDWTDDAPGPRFLDRWGGGFSTSSGLRASVALAAARMFVESGGVLDRLLLEEPAAFLHPSAQEALRARIVKFADETAIPVVIASETTFVVPRGADDLVVAVARDAAGALQVLGTARGDDRHADLVGGLFRDPGLATVLDRSATLGPETRAVLIVEGGTDEAYLELAARTLGREKELDGVVILAAGGASAAALQAVVLRAETALPVLVLFDNDDPGRRARDTLVKRLGFRKRLEATTYAEVLPGHPMGAEAEDLFDHRFVERFIAEAGPGSTSGNWTLWRDVQHHDLTSWGKSAFVRWATVQARAADVAAWGRLLDVLLVRFDEIRDASGRDRRS